MKSIMSGRLVADVMGFDLGRSNREAKPQQSLTLRAGSDESCVAM
jgi:hypothetical protein